MTVRILVGDMRKRLREIEDCSVDSCCTDPPYHLLSTVKRFGKVPRTESTMPKAGPYRRASKGFMGQTWDGGDVAFDPETWSEVYRVLKPGAHVVAFSGTRTYHRMACAIEDAGFEVRDQLAWVYGSGFPKSHNLDGDHEGWGSALKPSWEPICFARKPLVGTIAGNMALHGVGAINIDGCRIGVADASYARNCSGDRGHAGTRGAEQEGATNLRAGGASAAEGRWPANIIHDGCDEVVAAFPDSNGQMGAVGPQHGARSTVHCFGDYGPRPDTPPRGDSGSAARFFYSAKVTTAERGEGNSHPTVKPVDLMRWLCRLVTPKGGTVLDPFAGSGSTLIAADVEQMSAIGIELSPEYAAIAERRVRDAGGLYAEVVAA